MHHQLDLLLFGAAVADHAGLDFERRIFAEREAGFGDGEQHDAPRVRELQRGLDVLRVEDFFHGRRIRRVRGDDFAQAAGDGEQAGLEAARLVLVWMDPAAIMRWERPSLSIRP